MRVALLTPEYPPGPSGGIGTSTRNLATAMVELGHRAHVVTPGEQDQYEDGGVDVRVVDPHRQRKLGWPVMRRRLAKTLRRLVDDEGVEIVEAPDWAGLSAGARPRCSVVVRCHGSATYFAYLNGTSVRRGVRLAEALALRRADGVVAVSAFVAERTRALFRLRCPVPTIPNSVDVERFRPSAERSDPERVLYAGAVMRRKGVLDLCRAFSEVVRVRPSARLVVVGRDLRDTLTGRPSTWELCTEYLSGDARARTEYLGVQPHDQLPGLVAGATFCVLPSYAEAMPLAWLEAAACGKAVVGYDTPWAREVVVPGHSGFLVSPGEVQALASAVVRLLDDEELQRSAGAAARSIAVERFSPARVAEETVAWYRAVLSQRPMSTSR